MANTFGCLDFDVIHGRHSHFKIVSFVENYSEDCQFSQPIVGEISYGVNTGGCYFCQGENSDILMKGDELVAACEQMCRSDEK